MSACEKIARISLVFFNLIILGISGCLIFAAVVLNNEIYDLFIPSYELFIACCVIGGYLFIVALTGFVSSCAKKQCWRTSHISFMALFLIFEVSIGITSLVKDGPIQIKKTIHKRSLDSMNYWQHQDVQIIQDDIQFYFDCCGVDSYQDWSSQIIGQNEDMSFISWAIDQGWQQGKGYYNTTYPVPDSCLTAQYNWADYGLRYDPANVKFELRPYGENLGCFTKANKVLADNAGVAIGIIVSFFAVQIISMQCAIYLSRTKVRYVRFSNPIYIVENKNFEN